MSDGVITELCKRYIAHFVATRGKTPEDRAALEELWERMTPTERDMAEVALGREPTPKGQGL